MAETQRLRSDYYKNTDDQVTTTSTDPKEVEKTSEKRITWTPELKAENDRDKQALADAYEIDPATGRYKGTPGALLGFDPDEYIKRQKQDERNARSRARWKYWGDIANTLIELGTQHGGGTVFARQNNNELSEQEKKMQQARDNIFKVQQTGAQLTAERERAYREAERKRVNDFLKTNEQTVTHTTTEGGDRTVTKTGGDVTAHRDWDAQVGGKGGAGGSGSEWKFVVNVGDPGSIVHKEYELSQQEYKDVLGILKQHYTKLLNEVDADGVPTKRALDAAELMKQHRILKGEQSKSGVWPFDDNEIMRGGTFISLDDSQRDLLEKKSGGKIKFRRKGKNNTSTTNTSSTSTSTTTTTSSGGNGKGRLNRAKTTAQNGVDATTTR